MKVVLCRHAYREKEYLFKTDFDIDEGDICKAETINGEKTAFCVSDSLEVTDRVAETLMKSFGGTELRPILGKYYFLDFETMKKCNELITEVNTLELKGE